MALTLFATALHAQNTVRVKGTISDASGGPLAFATVAVRGIAAGTVADVDGKFEVEAPADGTLRVSYTGYGTIEVAVGGRTQIDITLAESPSALS